MAMAVAAHADEWGFEMWSRPKKAADAASAAHVPIRSSRFLKRTPRKRISSTAPDTTEPASAPAAIDHEPDERMSVRPRPAGTGHGLVRRRHSPICRLHALILSSCLDPVEATAQAREPCADCMRFHDPDSAAWLCGHRRRPHG
jgi:hypothetical protein